jgi:hypothetical protein
MPRSRKIPTGDGGEIEAEPIGFRSSGEHWNEYLLDDGSVLKLKPVVTEVLRVEGQYDPMGNPVYVLQSTNVVAVDSPDELKRQ